MIIFYVSQGWTLYEVLRYLPEHNWIAYEQALKANPVLAKMAISGIVYSIGDWIAQVSTLFPPLFFLSLLGRVREGSVSYWLNLFIVLNMQCYEGKPIFDFDRTRMFRSGLTGFTLHGSLSHYYYQLCEVIIMAHNLFILFYLLIYLDG